MKNSNSIIAGVMALIIVFGAGTELVHTKFSVPEETVIATSAETLRYGSLSYKIEENDTITITDFDDSVTEVEMPAEIDGKPVITIGKSAFSSKKIKSVTIPDSITSIGSSAFKSCTNLTSVSIPDSVVEMGESAFYGCTALQSVKLSGNVSAIGQSVFSSCTGLQEITISDGVTHIGNQAFDSCIGLKSIIFPDTLTFIDSYAFRSCSSLESVTIPASVASIGSDSFYNCKSLKEITIMNPNCTIGSSAIANEYSYYTGVIYGEEGSTAQKYAESKNFTFQTIDLKPKKGDLNGDGLVDSIDASVILGYYAYLSTKSEDEPAIDIDEYQATQQ